MMVMHPTSTTNELGLLYGCLSLSLQELSNSSTFIEKAITDSRHVNTQLYLERREKFRDKAEAYKLPAVTRPIRKPKFIN